MTMDRRSLAINFGQGVKGMMDAIARYIRSLTPTDPLFPTPLMPTRAVDAPPEAYNALELAGSCARLLAQHISEDRISNEHLQRLYNTTEDLRSLEIVPLTGQVLPRYIEDLTAISDRMAKTLGAKTLARKGSPNLKMPLMAAIVYAYEYVQAQTQLKTDLDL